MTKFSKDEQYTLMSLWCIFRSPLMFGGDLTSSDAFTLSLITNKEVLRVLKNSTNNHELFNADDKIAWIADDAATGDKYLALFNSSDNNDPAKISVALKDIGLNSSCTIHDLWSGKKLGIFTNVFSADINKHGAGLYRISKK